MLLIISGSILSIVVLLLIAASFTTKNYSIKKEVMINEPDSLVYIYLSHLKNHRNFNKWLKTDPNMKESFSGVDGTVGFIYCYDGNKKTGAGEQEITGLVKNKRIDIELRFKRPFKSICQTPYELNKINDNQTNVTWTMRGSFNYPMNAALLFINMDKFLGNDVQTSLNNLKTLLENKHQ